MTILAIETSCDETAVSIVRGTGGLRAPRFTILAHQVSSQIKIHEAWGGVVPNLAKREHEKNLVPVLLAALADAKLLKNSKKPITIPARRRAALKFFGREVELGHQFEAEIFRLAPPRIDAIAVTEGPGLEPALWVGINFAQALAALWKLPLIPVNHMEGHFVSGLGPSHQPGKITFPALGLLVSGGHTELILATNWGRYRLLGRTRDDAVGEAFDKVARLLGYPYPGGPAIGKAAAEAPNDFEAVLPRPMIHSDDFDFSYSGLKTAVLYLVQKFEKVHMLGENTKRAIAKEFQQAAIDVLIAKTTKAITTFAPKTLIAGGGVIANPELRRQLTTMAGTFPGLTLLIPDSLLTTDNASMIGMAAYLRAANKKSLPKKNPKLKARGNLALA